MSDSFQAHGLWPTILLCPWDFPGKSTGVGCHFLLQEYINIGSLTTINIFYYHKILKIRKAELYVLFLQLFCKSKIMIWEQPKCPSTDDWKKKMYYKYTIEYYQP